LLRAGVAPWHVRRYLAELTDHLIDLRTEEEGAGRDRADAETAALERLGGIDALAAAMIEQRQLQSWCARAPWAFLGLGPLAALAGAYLFAGLILWSGWMIFLPGAETPFGPRLHGLSILYFGVGRLDYFYAPILIGWGFALLAARQRSRAIWLVMGLIMNALIAGAVQFHAVRPHTPGAVGQVSVGFTFGHGRALAIWLLTMAPYFVWRVVRTVADSRLTAR